MILEAVGLSASAALTARPAARRAAARLRLMLSMICVDVDGTLVGTGNVVLPEVWEALAEARQAGVRIVLCSGRPAVGRALEYARQLDPDGWHIFQNGASIVKVDTGESRSEELPHDLLLGLVENGAGHPAHSGGLHRPRVRRRGHLAAFRWRTPIAGRAV